MFSRVALNFQPASTQVRGMATLKAISMRLKAVKNIQKITKSMKMVSAAKYARAEKELKPARTFGVGAQAFFQKADLPRDESKPNHLIIAMSSDRGLCGAVHSGVARAIKHAIPEKKAAGANVKIICIGDKTRAILARLYAKDMLMHFTEVGRVPPTYGDAAAIANAILNAGIQFDVGELHYNIFKTVLSYKTTKMPVYTQEAVSNAGKIGLYDALDDDVIQCYNEASLANLIYYAMKENACSEQSSRMTAMGAASKNAGEVIDKLSMTYNRTRQAVITRELIEIISGAAAL